MADKDELKYLKSIDNSLRGIARSMEKIERNTRRPGNGIPFGELNTPLPGQGVDAPAPGPNAAHIPEGYREG